MKPRYLMGSKTPEVYDQFSNGSFSRTLVGIQIEDNHRCFYHAKPCPTPVYVLTDTDHRMFAPSKWCAYALADNGYTLTGKKSDPLFLCRCHTSFTHLYVMKLQHNKWYVGITSRPKERISEHKDSKGAKWTTRHPVLTVESLIKFKTRLPECEATIKENLKTHELCKQYGWENVRGGSWNG